MNSYRIGEPWDQVASWLVRNWAGSLLESVCRLAPAAHRPCRTGCAVAGAVRGRGSQPRNDRQSREGPGGRSRLSKSGCGPALSARRHVFTIFNGPAHRAPGGSPGDRSQPFPRSRHRLRLIQCHGRSGQDDWRVAGVVPGRSVPELSNVFRRCNIPFFQITGMLDNDPAAWNEIQEWLDAARVVHTMEHNRLGVMGHYYGGMLDVYSDLTLQCATFGGHIEMVEV